MRTLERTADVAKALTCAAIIVILTAGCGEDDDDAEVANSAPAATAELPSSAATEAPAITETATPACTALVEFNTAAAGDENTDTSTADGAKALGGVLAPMWDEAQTVMPASVEADVDVVTAAIGDLEAGDGAAFDADATYASYVRTLDATIDPCGFTRHTVSADDSEGHYMFTGIPARLSPGVLAVTLDNDGYEPHVLIVYRKNDGETRSAEELLALPEEEGRKVGTETGSVYAEGGDTGTSLVTLTPGDYVYFCPIPIDGTGAPHFTEGMYGEFTVA